MTKRDFFRIIIKIFALYSLILTVFSWIPSNFIYTVYDFELIPILAALGFTLIALLIYYFLIKKTDSIIDFIKIDKGFDDVNIEIGNLKSDKILMLGIIIIGGLLLVTNLADFIQYSFLAFKSKVSKGGVLSEVFGESFGSANDFFNWTYSVINIVIGYLLLTNSERVAKWLDRKERNVG